jgi:Xaa-Pro dipeptidase
MAFGNSGYCNSTDLHKAKQHARSVAKHLGVKEGLIYLLGQRSRLLEDSDMPVPFRQRRFFYYLSGADFEACIVTYDIERDDLRLYIPPANPYAVIWLGPTPSIEECEEKYDIDYACLTSGVNNYITNWLQNSRNRNPTIYILHENQGPGMGNSDPTFQTIFSNKKLVLDWTHLQPAMESARVIKSDYEVELIRRANEISSMAHSAVLSNITNMTNETEIEAMFGASCVSAGAKKQAYEIIAGSGENASILHYVANNQPLKGRQLVCLDAGCEWDCYASDVTRTFPISGSYSQEAKEIYLIVEEMQERCIERIKPGVVFRDLHLLAMEIAVKGLMKLGILHNGTFEEILPTGACFFPHGV